MGQFPSEQRLNPPELVFFWGTDGGETSRGFDLKGCPFLKNVGMFRQKRTPHGQTSSQWLTLSFA